MDEGRHLEEVADEHEQEDRQQPREVLDAVLRPDDADGDLVSDEADDRLDEGAELARDQPLLGSDDAEVEDPHHDECRHHGERHGPIPETEEGKLEQFVDA